MKMTLEEYVSVNQVLLSLAGGRIKERIQTPLCMWSEYREIATIYGTVIYDWEFKNIVGLNYYDGMRPALTRWIEYRVRAGKSVPEEKYVLRARPRTASLATTVPTYMYTVPTYTYTYMYIPYEKIFDPAVPFLKDWAEDVLRLVYNKLQYHMEYYG